MNEKHNNIILEYVKPTLKEITPKFYCSINRDCPFNHKCISAGNVCSNLYMKAETEEGD